MFTKRILILRGGGAFALCISDLQAVRIFVVAAVIVVLTSLLAKMGSDLHLSFQLRDQLMRSLLRPEEAHTSGLVMRMAMW